MDASPESPPNFRNAADHLRRPADTRLELIRWSAQLDTAQLRGLYATFSTLTALPPDDQQKLLDELVQLAQSRFGCSVERRFVTAVYGASRKAV